VSLLAGEHLLAAPSGLSIPGVANTTISPAATVTASNLSVQLTTPAPSGSGGDMIVEVAPGGAGVFIGCGVPSGRTTCTVGGGGVIPPNNPLAVNVINDTGGTFEGDVLFGYQLTG
jgi:hypothetical protein